MVSHSAGVKLPLSRGREAAVRSKVEPAFLLPLSLLPLFLLALGCRRGCSCCASADRSCVARLGLGPFLQRILPSLPFCAFSASLSSDQVREERLAARLESVGARLDLALPHDCWLRRSYSSSEARPEHSSRPHFVVRARAPLGKIQSELCRTSSARSASAQFEKVDRSTAFAVRASSSESPKSLNRAKEMSSSL